MADAVTVSVLLAEETLFFKVMERYCSPSDKCGATLGAVVVDGSAAGTNSMRFLFKTPLKTFRAFSVSESESIIMTCWSLRVSLRISKK